MSEPTSRAVSIFSKIADIDSASWDAAANPDPARYDPFVSHAFLAALESSGSVGRGTGWSPAHLALEDRTGGIAGVMPLYSKTHSQGEYVFDHAWAEVLRRVGIPYYPKLQSAVPFTPVPGRRLLIRPDVDEAEAVTCLAAAGIEIATQNGMSSLHVTFLSDPECRLLEPLGFLTRTGIQYHWTNAGYGSFDDFLATLSSRKRKALRRERADALTGGLTIERITGIDVTLKEFTVRSVTVGEDAQGEAQIEAEHNGRKLRGRGVSTDIIEASALAFVQVINRALLREQMRMNPQTEQVTPA